MTSSVTDGVQIRLVDIVAQARDTSGERYVRYLDELRLGGLVAEDWRWEIVLPGGAEVGMSSAATATDVANYLKRDRAEREAGR